MDTTDDADTYEWETFDKRAIPLVKRPQVTIQGGGSLSFNASAYHALGEPRAVELLYDRSHHVIGFRAVEPEANRAYPIRPQGQNAKTFIVSGRAFLAYYSIPFGEAIRRDCKVINGVLILDLNDPGVEATSNRNRARARASDDNQNAQNGQGSSTMAMSDQDSG